MSDGVDDVPRGRSNKLRPVTRQVVWARGAGRCHICNSDLVGDLITGAEDANFGFVAHIVADTPTGPRGEATKSHELADNPANLMLLCYPHHKAVDVDQVDDYPVERLLDIKRDHEARIAVQTAIRPDRSTTVVRYAANVGQHRVLMPYQDIVAALLPGRYPADRATVDLTMRGSVLEDGELEFWKTEATNLRRLFATRVRERLEAGDAHHLSIFALAPQPLLILLGTLIGDITPADVFQRHREPPDWCWPPDGPAMLINVGAPGESAVGPVALKIALSATVNDDRIRSVLGEHAAIWSVTTPRPHNDVLKRAEDLQRFKLEMRGLFDRIKARHGGGIPCTYFPPCPSRRRWKRDASGCLKPICQCCCGMKTGLLVVFARPLLSNQRRSRPVRRIRSPFKALPNGRIQSRRGRRQTTATRARHRCYPRGRDPRSATC